MKKNNKKGFTLIELLAVIAILAILVVLAVPTMLDVFSGAKENAFRTQAQSILKAAEQQIISSQINGTSPVQGFCKPTSGTANQNLLSMDVASNVSYKISVSGDEVVSVLISDSEFSIKYPASGTVANVSVSDLSKPLELGSTQPITCP